MIRGRKAKTTEENSSKKTEEEVKQIEEERESLKRQLQVFQDLHNLKNQEYFRREMLMVLERIANALEESLKESGEESEED
jgi:hypothetical protein